MYIDAHSHLADQRFSESEVDLVIKESLAKNISLFMQAGVGPADWQKQILLKNKYPKNILLAFGLHPYFVAENSREDCEVAMDELAQNIFQCQGIGETGLDFRDQFVGLNPDVEKEKQITFFETHIELAKLTSKPLILHVVRAHDEALRILKTWDPPKSGGLVHAFNGSFEIANEYIKLGLMISVGGAVTYEKNSKLKNAVEKIPLDRILIESDSPDQPPKGWFGLNHPTSLWLIAGEIAKIKNISVDLVMETATLNFKRLFKI